MGHCQMLRIVLVSGLHPKMRCDEEQLYTKRGLQPSRCYFRLYWRPRGGRVLSGGPVFSGVRGIESFNGLMALALFLFTMLNSVESRDLHDILFSCKIVFHMHCWAQRRGCISKLDAVTCITGGEGQLLTTWNALSKRSTERGLELVVCTGTRMLQASFIGASTSKAALRRVSHTWWWPDISTGQRGQLAISSDSAEEWCRVFKGSIRVVRHEAQLCSIEKKIGRLLGKRSPL